MQKQLEPMPYPWPQLTELWGNEELSTEQAIDQLLIWGQIQHEALRKATRQLEEQERDIADLTAQVVEAKPKDGDA